MHDRKNKMQQNRVEPSVSVEKLIIG